MRDYFSIKKLEFQNQTVASRRDERSDMKMDDAEHEANLQILRNRLGNTKYEIFYKRYIEEYTITSLTQEYEMSYKDVRSILNEAVDIARFVFKDIDSLIEGAELTSFTEAHRNEIDDDISWAIIE
jgi:hypothetical protein